jgi:hypothetical protein
MIRKLKVEERYKPKGFGKDLEYLAKFFLSEDVENNFLLKRPLAALIIIGKDFYIVKPNEDDKLIVLL